MGELVTFAVEQFLEKAIPFAAQEIAGAWRLKKDLEKLSELTSSIHGQVQEAHNNQAANGKTVKPLLVKLQKVLYYAEDVLEDFSYETLRRQIENQPQRSLWIRIRGFASRNNPILFRVKMAHKVEKINKSLADIKKQAIRDLFLTGKPVVDGAAVSKNQVDRVTVSGFDQLEPPVTGRASEKKEIINMLQQSSSTPSRLTVVSIVGFGGIGKTTLAKMVLHQVKETKLFDETIWVCVSETFKVDKILKDMLEILDKSTADNREAILQRLGEKLKDKRFLLVLDDMWEDNSTSCHNLRSYLQNIGSGAGSFVIVTTRKLGVADAMVTQKEHVVKLKELKDTECWDIIKKKCEMQWGESVPVPEDLKKIGLEIGRKCKGVPLAAKVIGGTLCKKNHGEWLAILNSHAWDQIDAWDQINEDEKILPILKLSFHHLDASLKQCFVYCSLFPKDVIYEKQKLIELWMAEGFLNTASITNRGSSEKKSMEDFGEEFFNGLISYSFFEDVQVDKFGNIIACKMHDLLHDVATSVSNYKTLKLKEESVFFVRTSDHQHQPTVQELESDGARMVRCVISGDIGEVSYMFSTFKSLRSLDLSSAGLEELPSIVGRLKQLRYLDISYNEDMKELSEFITKLYNLQLIRLIGCKGITKLPTNMINLVRLRHIHFDMRCLEIYNVGHLIELRTLPYFEVRKEKGFLIEEVSKLNELTGKLEIFNLQNVSDKKEAERANLKEKKNLIELRLEWDSNSIDSKRNDEDVLEGLLPPPTIKSLKIENYRGVKFPNWRIEDDQEKSVVVFPLLDKLKIQNCPRLRSIPLRHLSSLVSLKIYNCEDMEYLSNDIQNLPSLDHLKIRKCRNLVSLSNLQQLKSLKKLRIKYCDGLTSLSKGLVSLQTLEMNSCGDLSEDAFCGLSSLQFLSLFNVRMKSIPNIEHPSSLEELTIWDCPELTSVPNWLKFCTSLRKLHIRWCEKLISHKDGSAMACYVLS